MIFTNSSAILHSRGIFYLGESGYEQRNQITEGVIWKQLLLFFFPIVFGTFFQQIYNTADHNCCRSFVGKEALAAVGGSVNQIVNLIVEVFVGLLPELRLLYLSFRRPGQENLDKPYITSMLFLWRQE
mgnify:CR=1 FL=1